MMKKTILLLMAFAVALTAAAQQKQLEEIASRIGTHRISLHYDCTFTQDVPVKLTGTLLVQGACYQAKGNGMEIYCDGKTRWTVDPASKEVYVETAEGLEELMAWRDSLTDLDLTGIQYMPLSEDLSAFRFDTASLGGDWVVTDLR